MKRSENSSDEPVKCRKLAYVGESYCHLQFKTYRLLTIFLKVVKTVGREEESVIQRFLALIV